MSLHKCKQEKKDSEHLFLLHLDLVLNDVVVKVFCKMPCRL